MRPLSRSINQCVVCIAILMVSCKPTIPNQANNNAVEQLVIQKLGRYEMYQNASGTYSLYVQKIEEEATANPVTRFLVVDLASKKIMVEKSFKPGYVKWIDDSTLELLDAPGILKQNDTLSDYIKKIDLSILKQ